MDSIFCVFNRSGVLLGNHEPYHPKNKGNTNGTFKRKDKRTRLSWKGAFHMSYVLHSPLTNTLSTGTSASRARRINPDLLNERQSSPNSAITNSGTPPGTTMTECPFRKALSMMSYRAGIQPSARTHQPSTGMKNNMGATQNTVGEFGTK